MAGTEGMELCSSRLDVQCSDAQAVSVPGARVDESPVLRQTAGVDGSAVSVPFSSKTMASWCSCTVDSDACLPELLAVAEVRSPLATASDSVPDGTLCFHTLVSQLRQLHGWPEGPGRIRLA